MRVQKWDMTFTPKVLIIQFYVRALHGVCRNPLSHIFRGKVEDQFALRYPGIVNDDRRMPDLREQR